MNYSELRSPFGVIGVCWQDERLSRVLLAPEPRPAGAEEAGALSVPAWLRGEFETYFADPHYRLACATETVGTEFQRRVWALIAAIPPGYTRTYGALAQSLQSSARAVGNACRANPVPLRIPCHRVVAARGLGGFAGDCDGRLVQIKRWLLAHEAAARDAAKAA